MVGEVFTAVVLVHKQEVLSDDDRRAEYDELVGHSEAAVNPFLQTGLPRDQVTQRLFCLTNSRLYPVFMSL